MSTLPNQPSEAPAWKQEVNRRIAAHRNRQAATATDSESLSETHHGASARAAAAAARVAARYANAPSYSDLLAGEARAAVRAAEAASRAALEAQATAEQILAGIEAAAAAPPVVWELHSSSPSVEVLEPSDTVEENSKPEMAFHEAPAEPTSEPRPFDSQAFEIRWEPDLPIRSVEPDAFRATLGSESSSVEMDSRAMPTSPVQDGLDGDPIEAVEPAQPIHANLIEFPREIVATRKVRPRRIEGAFATSEPQLSIFEVDPSAISIDPTPSVAEEMAASPAWTDAEWPGIELDAQPRTELLPNELQEQPAPEARAASPKEVLSAAIDARGAAPMPRVAPFSLRMMAALVDTSLIAGAFLSAAIMALASVRGLPSLREFEVGSVMAILLVATLYQSLFYILAKSTPGMMYAGISMRTFEGRSPTRAQRCRRLLALLLSTLPLGLGVVWAVFDEDHLGWHDRLSGTYLREY